MRNISKIALLMIYLLATLYYNQATPAANNALRKSLGKLLNPSILILLSTLTTS
jgi:hypothetical protein